MKRSNEGEREKSGEAETRRSEWGGGVYLRAGRTGPGGKTDADSTGLLLAGPGGGDFACAHQPSDPSSGGPGALLTGSAPYGSPGLGDHAAEI